MRRAVGSCTTPRSICASGPSHGHPYGVHRSVGAMRGAATPAGRNIVSFMPSGSKMCSLRELVERLAADAPDDVAEQEEVDVAVDEPLAGRRGRDLLDRQLDGLVVAGPLVAEIDVRPQPGCVRQQVPDR